MRTECPNIHMYRRGKYTKNPLKKYNNRKVYYTSNIPLKLMVDQEH
jgi:hypothetical protein